MAKDGILTQLVIELTKGIDRASCLTKYCKKWQMSPRTFDRHWKAANERYRDSQLEIQKEIKQQTIDQTVQSFSEASITRDRVLQEYSRIAFSDVTSFFNQDGSFIGFDNLTPDQRAVLSSMEVEEFTVKGKSKGAIRKLKVWDKRGALDAIVKIMGWNAPIKGEMTGKDGEPLFAGFDAFMAKCRTVKLEDDE